MRVYPFWTAAIVVVSLYATAAPTLAQRAPQSQGDPREAVALSPVEAEKMLTGMRTYLETIQGIVAALAENDTSRVPALAMKSGAKMLEEVAPTTGLKTPMGFSMMSFDTHDKFDKLADKAAKGSSRSELLKDLRDIMGNCISCHAAYRLAP
jgi:cytochrome c556